MLRRVSTLLALTFLVTLGFAKDKTKNTLPPYVLQAKTVAIIIDPNAGMSIDDPQANERAQKDVEAALLKWGRFDLVSETKSADLIIVVRKGNGRPMDDAMSDPRQNNGGDAINSSGRGGSMGPPRGSLPPSPADTQSRHESGWERIFLLFSKAARIPSMRILRGSIWARTASARRRSPQSGRSERQFRPPRRPELRNPSYQRSIHRWQTSAISLAQHRQPLPVGWHPRVYDQGSEQIPALPPVRSHSELLLWAPQPSVRSQLDG